MYKWLLVYSGMMNTANVTTVGFHLLGVMVCATLSKHPLLRLNACRYYVSVQGKGVGNPSAAASSAGYSDYGCIGEYSLVS
jgi:hypothetical protein